MCMVIFVHFQWNEQKMYSSHVFRRSISCLFPHVHHSCSIKHIVTVRYVSSSSILQVLSKKPGRATEKDEDYFGIETDESQPNDFQYPSLDNKLKQRLTAQTQPRKRHTAKVELKPFGSVRFDGPDPQQQNLNPTNGPGHSDLLFGTNVTQNRNPGRREIPADNKQTKDNSYIDDQYFEYSGHNSGKSRTDSAADFNGKKNNMQHAAIKPEVKHINSINLKDIEFLEASNSKDDKQEDSHSNYIDDQYFEYNRNLKTHDFNDTRFQSTTDTDMDKECSQNDIDSFFSRETDVNEIDKQYFVNTEVNFPTHKRTDDINFEKGQHLSKSMSIGDQKTVDTTDEYEQKAQGESKKVKKIKAIHEAKEGDDKQETAYDVAIKIREQTERKNMANLWGRMDPREYDSKGFKILTHQVPHFDNAPSMDVIKVLQQRIIYDKDDVVAINKPYGLPSHDGPGTFHSIAKFLDNIIPRTELFPVHRLDKETTGVMLFAKSESVANELSEYFLKREVVKRYLCITKNIPEASAGEIDIPIAEGTVNGKVRMALRPYNAPDLHAVMKKRQPGTEAVTRYRVLDRGVKCSLLECFPLTGKKHQVRVHLALGLNCPILGDHKYSHVNKIAPMRLHPDILKQLHIQQSKVRHLAMHLHARSVMIPGMLNGRNLFISAPLPIHFIKNMKELKLKLPAHM